MKFVVARSISGFFASLFIIWSVVLFAYDIRMYWNFLSYPSFRADFMRDMAMDTTVLVFGVFCLIRFRYWHRKAIETDKKERNGGTQDRSSL